MRTETNHERILEFMDRLGQSVRSSGNVYFTGGVTAILMGWRDTTIDIDLKADPEPQGFFDRLPFLKESLGVNVELAAPDQFIPELSGWRERSQTIDRCGLVSYYHYDFYSQAMAKIERDHPRDQSDVAQMFRGGLLDPEELWRLFQDMEPHLRRFPAIDPSRFRARVRALTQPSA